VYDKINLIYMPIVEGVKRLFSTSSRKIFGRHRHYGRAMFGWSSFGDDDIIVSVKNTPLTREDHIFSGIYSLKHLNNKRQFMRNEYYSPYNPRTEPQQSNREKIADAVLAWQALTSEQKGFYNERAKGKHYSGYNLFVKEYCLSH